MSNLFSHPQFVPSGNYSVTGYALYKSTANGTAPNYFGPWEAVDGFDNYTTTTDILDAAGTYWDLYRVAPSIKMTNGGATATLPMSRPFKASDTLYDVQISALVEHFRSNLIDDRPIRQEETTNPQEGTGAGIMPFITNSTTSRFWFSFMPNANPIRTIPDETVVWAGADVSSATPLTPYTDYFVSESGGFIDFASVPDTGSYLKVEYQTVRVTTTECRNMLLNAVSALSLYGINGYQVMQSNNLLYLASPLANRDLGEIVCLIAAKNYLQSKVQSSFESAEAWKDGKVEFSADPSRSIQAATVAIGEYDEMLRHRANGYIIANRNAGTYQGEFDSFFNTSGILPVYSLIVSNWNSWGWWM